MAQATNTTSTSNKASKGASKASKQAPAVQAPAGAATPFKGMLQQLAKQGAATAAKATKGVNATATQAGNVAPVGVATRNAGKAATIPGFALVGVNGRKQPLASSVTAQIWLAALAYQLANNGTMPTQAHIKLACPTVNPTSCGLGLTQYKAYTGQVKGMATLTIAQLQAMAQAPAAPAPSATA
jgi:hypothetical protein